MKRLTKSTKKLIAFFLVMLSLMLSLTSCFSGTYLRGDTMYNLDWLNGQSIYAKVEADHFVFDKNDVTLDFNYGLYQLGNMTLDQVKKTYCYIPSEEELQNGMLYSESDFAIYISNSEELVFESKEDGSLIDPQNKVNAKLWKYISYDDAFSTNYGYTSISLKVIYNHGEKITIPAEFFSSENDHRVYIHIVLLWRNSEGTIHSCSNAQNDYYYSKYALDYMLFGDSVILY